MLLEAFAGLPDSSDWRLVVAGEPWEGLESQLVGLIDERGLGDRVRTELRWIPESEVPGLLAACDLVVLPYRSGSQSAVAPLALSAGLPVLSTRVGGLSEVVQDGMNGVLVEAGSIDELARAFEEMDDERLGTLAEGARRSRDRLTWDGYAAALEDLLEDVAGANSEFGTRNSEFPSVRS